MDDFKQDSFQQTSSSGEVNFLMADPPPQEDPQQKIQKKHRQKKHSSVKRMVVTACCVCVLGSGAMGFLGGMLASNLGSSSSGGVLYQSVDRVSTSSGEDSGSALSVAEIANLAANSVVEIRTETTQQSFRGTQTSEGAGSGIIVTNDGYITTNNHVIEGAGSITVTLKNGESYSATLVATDPDTDIALLKIEAENLQPVVFGDSDSLIVGEAAVAIGNPLGELGGTVTNGIISALDREITLDGQTMNLLQTNAAINPGNSGGGLFNAQGELVGMIVAKSTGTDVEGLGFAIPSNDVKEVVTQLMENGYVQGRIRVGLTLVEINDASSAMMMRTQQTGLYVQSVSENSAAQQAGVQAGDRIISADGTVVNTTAELKEVFNAHSVGDVIQLTVERDGRQITMDLTLTEYKPS